MTLYNKISSVNIHRQSLIENKTIQHILDAKQEHEWRAATHPPAPLSER